MNRVFWISNAQEREATEIDIFIIGPNVPVTNCPGKNTMETSLIGSFALENAETVWAVYRRVPMPDFANAPRGVGRFYNGACEKDLESETLRALAFGSEPDGSRTIFHCAVQPRKPGEPVKVVT